MCLLTRTQLTVGSDLLNELFGELPLVEIIGSVVGNGFERRGQVLLNQELAFAQCVVGVRAPEGRPADAVVWDSLRAMLLHPQTCVDIRAEWMNGSMNVYA